MATIINLAQNYIGSNNVNLLLPVGQFGTRLHGGKDAASPRYHAHPVPRPHSLLYTQWNIVLIIVCCIVEYVINF